MSVDYKWMSNGGLVSDGSGDISFTDSPIECATAMVRSRLKAAIDGWKLYRIGAGLDDFPGNTSNSDIETAIRRRVISALSNKYLPASAFDVRTIRLGSQIQVYVYLNKQLITQVTITPQATNPVI